MSAEDQGDEDEPTSADEALDHIHELRDLLHPDPGDEAPQRRKMIEDVATGERHAFASDPELDPEQEVVIAGRRWKVVEVEDDTH